MDELRQILDVLKDHAKHCGIVAVAILGHLPCARPVFPLPLSRTCKIGLSATTGEAVGRIHEGSGDTTGVVLVNEHDCRLASRDREGREPRGSEGAVAGELGKGKRPSHSARFERLDPRTRQPFIAQWACVARPAKVIGRSQQR